MSFTDAEEIAVLNARYRSEAMEVAIHTASPGEAGSTANEVVGPPRATTTFSDPALGQPISNELVLEWDNMPDDGTDPPNPGTTITHVSVHRVSDGGMVSYGEIPSLVRVPVTETARIPVGGLTLTLN